MANALTQKGQVTIPKVWRDKLGLKTGDAIEFFSNDNGGLELKAVTLPCDSFVDKLRKAKIDFAPNFNTGGMDGLEYIRWLRNE
jgi:AbrB family looped-hinge helix DNA binding protein